MYKKNTDKKQKSIDFKKDVIKLYQKGYAVNAIAVALNKKYNDNMDGPFFERFKKRIGMCICRYKRSEDPKINLAESLRWRHCNSKKIADIERVEGTKKGTKITVVRNVEPTKHKRKWDGATEIKIAVIGDTHLGSKYTQFKHLNDFYDVCKSEGVKDVYHVGDLTDGLKMRPGHEYELYVTSADDMIDDVIEKYPSRKGVITHFITGNHDASIYKHVGYDIGKTISERREDMDYLGRDCAVINLTSKCTLELRHPWDGTAYALSYKPQKMIEAMESDSKPNILAIGHYHKAEYLFYRNVHTIQTGSFQGQTPFTRGKGISVNLGGWIITIQVMKDGSIKSIIPQFIPYYKSISNDYKNR